MDKGDPLDSGPELHAILRAADNGLLQAIENNLDLNAGFSRLISELPEVAPADTQRSPARTGPRRAGLYAARVAGAPAEGRWLSPLAVNGGGGAAPHNRSRLIMLGLAVALALNIGVLTSLIHNSATSPQPGASGIALPANHLPHEPAIGRRFPPPRPQQVIILGSPGAFAPLGDFAAGAGIGGNPVISYLENSGKGSMIQISGIPKGTKIIYFNADLRQSFTKYAGDGLATVSFPTSGDHPSFTANISLTNTGGRILLRTLKAKSDGRIGVLVTWFPDLA